MKIGILGAGFVGQSFAKALMTSGHEVMVSSRNPSSEKMQSIKQTLRVNVGTVQETIAFGDIVAFALRWDAVQNVVAVGDWQGKIIIDMMNRFGGDDGLSAGETLAQMLPQSHVVKALNTIGAEHYTAPNFAGEQATMFIAGNQVDAKSTVTQLLSELGFDVVDIGNIQASRHLENLAAFWVYLAMQTDLGRDIAFKMLSK